MKSRRKPVRCAKAKCRTILRNSSWATVRNRPCSVIRRNGLIERGREDIIVRYCDDCWTTVAPP